MKLSAYRISLLYIVISFLWIALSDRLLFQFQSQMPGSLFALVNSTKGILFVIVTGMCLYKLIKINKHHAEQNEKQYRIIYENNPLPMWIYNTQSLRIVSVNNAAIANYGYSKDEFLSKSILDIRPREDIAKVLKAVCNVSKDPQQTSGWVHIKADGSQIFVNISSQVIDYDNNRKGQHVMVIASDVTEKVKFEKTLEELNANLNLEKQKLRETHQIAKVGGWEYFPIHERLIFSEEMYSVCGIETATTGGNLLYHFMRHIHAEDRHLFTHAMALLTQSGKILDVSFRITLPGGSIKHIHMLGHLSNKPGHPLKITGSAQDITELKQLEHERNKFWINLEDTLNNINDGFYALDKNLVFTKINKNFELETGLSSDVVIGKKIDEVFPAIRKKASYSHFKKILKDKTSTKFETYSEDFNKWLSVSAYPTEEGIAVYMNDITERKRIDIQLKEAVERYEMVSMATQDVTYDYNILTDNLIYNSRIRNLVNVGETGKIDANLDWWRSLIHPEDIEMVSSTQKSIISNKQTNWECEYRIYCGEAGYKYVFDQGYFIYNDGAEPVRLIGAIKDINALRLAAEENRHLARVITNVNNLILIIDTENKIQWVNKAFEEQTGYTYEEVIGVNRALILSGNDTSKETLEYLAASKRKRKPFSVEYEQYTKNKGKHWVSSDYTPLFDNQGNFTGYIAVQTIVSARKEREAQIAAQNKVLHEIAWLSSHEIRRPVASILGLSYLYKNTDTNEKDEIMNMIDQCANELDNIVHSITARINSELSAIYIPDDEKFEPDVILHQARFSN